jgi:HD-GYP domain-containing protein (c-di-GMP phosphodiesterase class II)
MKKRGGEKHASDKTYRNLLRLLKKLKDYEVHSRHSAEYARMICMKMGVGGDEREAIEFAALFHELGKLEKASGRTILDIVNEPKKLGKKELALVKLHSVTGALVVLKESREYPWCKVADLILFHHEHFDGTGYPFGLGGNRIPLGARIISVAESFDAMLHPRPYRRAFSKKEAIARLKREAGKTFDKRVVKAFLEVIGSK